MPPTGPFDGAMYRQLIRIRSTGAKVGCKQLRVWIKAGRLVFFRSREDASPHVCDLAESLAQTAMHTTHPVSSTVRMHAAGTVAARGHVEADGYVPLPTCPAPYGSSG